MIPELDSLTGGYGIAGIPLPTETPVPGPAPARVVLSAGGGRPVLAVAGELDIAVADQVAADLRGHLSRCPVGEVGLDLSGVSFCDCGGLRALLSARKHAARQGCRLHLDRVSRPMERILRLTATRDLFEARRRQPVARAA
ncbi:STAS domain-containing protein [Kitasatospora sp. NPDC057223]|uniref:STAS domain-containing protein n=1 Tax=Kitasatospora sp. NPDC057223 TaxID=3346055 RepID=UPI003633760B